MSIELSPQADTPLVLLQAPPLRGAITLQLPELISDMDRRLVYFFTNLKGGVAWQCRPDGRLVAHWRQEGLAAYHLTALPAADGLLLDWRITNLSPETWPYAAGTVCMRSHEAPDFYDPSAERTFLRRDGCWIPVRETWKRPGSNWFLPPGKPPCNLMRPLIAEGGWALSDFEPDEAIMVVRSGDGEWLLAQAWHEARYLIANIRDDYACTDVCPSLGDIAPGSTVRAQGKIYCLRGSLAELAEKYKADCESGEICFVR